MQILLEDDLDGSKADETISFGLDGTTYELDLSKANAKKLREALAPYVNVGRKVTPRARGRSTGAGRGRRGSTSAAEIRAWAREHGYEVSDRGRVPAEVRAAYTAAR